MQSMMGTRNTFKAQKGSKEGHSWNSPCDISGSSLILSSYENAFCAQKLIFFSNNFLSSVSLFDACSWEYYNAYVWCCWCRSRRSDVEPGCAALCFQAEEYTHMSWYSHEHVSTDTEVKKLLNQVFFCTKFFCSYIKLWLNHRCHMDYFNDVFITFLGLERDGCVAFYAGSESSRISSKVS